MKHRPESDYLTKEDLFTDEEIVEMDQEMVLINWLRFVYLLDGGLDTVEYPDLWGNLG